MSVLLSKTEKEPNPYRKNILSVNNFGLVINFGTKDRPLQLKKRKVNL
jgi:hypothetical protein